MSELDFSKIQVPEIDFTGKITDSFHMKQEEYIKIMQESIEERDAEKLRRHNELIAALKEAGEKGATIIIGDNANGIQIQQNSARAQQTMYNSHELDYEKVAIVLKEISSYIDYPQFIQTFGDNSENVRLLIDNTLGAVEKHEDEGLIKSALKLLKELAIGASGSLIASGILALLGTLSI